MIEKRKADQGTEEHKARASQLETFSTNHHILIAIYASRYEVENLEEFTPVFSDIALRMECAAIKFW